MGGPPAVISIEDLVGSRVVSAEGKRLGNVVELEATPGPEYRVTSLVVGRQGWLERLNLRPAVDPRLGSPRRIPWDAVARFERLTVTLKPGRGGGGDQDT